MTASTVATNNLTGSYKSVIKLIETADTIDTTNGNRVLIGNYEKIVVVFHLSAATANDVVRLVAGDRPPAFRAGIGNQDYECAGGAAELVVGPIDTSKYANDDGYIYFTFPTATTLAGTMEAYGMD